MEQCLFSVIIPIFQVEKYLEETIQSLLVQTIGFEEHIQLILVDDGSTDGSSAICRRYAERYPENIVSIQQENSGVSAARNRGMAEVSGAYVNFLDADDKWEPDAFAQIHRYFLRHTALQLVACRMRFFDASENYHPLDYTFNKNCVVDLANPAQKSLIHLHITSTVLRRRALEGMRFQEGMPLAEDALFVNQLILREGRYGLLREAVCRYRKRRDNSSATQGVWRKKFYYTQTLRDFLMPLIAASKQNYGTVVPMLQELIIYEMGWRVTHPIPEGLLTEQERADYLALMGTLLADVEGKAILYNKAHRQMMRRYSILQLKYGERLKELTNVRSEYGRVNIDTAGRVAVISEAALASVTAFEWKEKHLHLEGTFANWLALVVGETPEIYFRVEGSKKHWHPEWYDCPESVAEYICLRVENRRNFTVDIPSKELFANGAIADVRLWVKFPGSCAPTQFRYEGRLNGGAAYPEQWFLMQGRYYIHPTAKVLQVRKIDGGRRARYELEQTYEKSLKQHGQREVYALRRRYWLHKLLLGKKKQWMIVDTPKNTVGETLFRLLKEQKRQEKIFFAASPDSPAYKRVKHTTSVLDTQSKKYQRCLMNSELVLSVEGKTALMERSFGKEQAGMLLDLFQFRYIPLTEEPEQTQLKGILTQIDGE